MTTDKKDEKRPAKDAGGAAVSSGGGGGSTGGDFAEQASGALSRLSYELSRATPTQQALAGGGGGCVLGFVVGRVGRTAALAVGGGLVCLQVAQQRGLITVNWSRVDRARRAAAEEAEAAGLPWLLDGARRMFAAHGYFATAFMGGFLVGLAAS